MQFTVDIKYNELLKIIKQLPAFQIEKLKAEINDDLIIQKSKTEKSEFQKFLLSGPIMSDEQYKIFQENREKFIKWRSK
ncbi:MAG: hypothetical protein K8R37_07825 [Bacteroidales bacterium]|nr:hypothetical protein [Bacteroidales bacterium]